MKSATVTTVLDAPQQAVFNYMADIEHLPEWATEFARELRREGDDYKVVNGLGEFYFAIAAEPEPDELFDAQHASLRREFANIERLLAARQPSARSASSG